MVKRHIRTERRRVAPASDGRKTRLRKISAPVGILLILCVFLVQAAVLWDFSIDDISISYRYAQHLAEGKGLIWNAAGVPVEGYSNLLWVLILGGGKVVGFDIELTAKILGLLLGLVNLVMLGILCRRLRLSETYWWTPVLLVAVTPEWVAWILSGLEIALYCTLLLSSIVALVLNERTRNTILTVSLPALVLVRPEGLAMAATVLAWLLFSDRELSLRRRTRRIVTPGLAVLVTLVGLVVFRLVYYGYPLPNTVYAKFSTDMPSLTRILEWWFFGLPFLIAWLLLVRVKTRAGTGIALGASASLVIMQTLVVLPVHPVMYFLHRYQIAVLPFLVLPVPLLLGQLERYRKWVPALAFLGIMGWSLQGWPATHYKLIRERHCQEKQRCVVECLNSLPRRPTIALLDAGRIPYWTDLPSLDVWGLCNAETAHEGFSAASALTRLPEVYVMSTEIMDRDSIPAIGTIGVRPALSRDAEIEQSTIFQEQYALWKICTRPEGATDCAQYDYALYLNAAWARRIGLAGEIGTRGPG